MDILADLGNTRLKWGIFQGKSIRSGEPLVHGDTAFGQRLLEAWRSLEEQPRRLALSSVAAPELAERLCRLAKSLWPDIEILRPRAEDRALGVLSAYRIPEKLGVDRWLCLLAARRYHPLPVCIADFGTAVTVDVLDAQGIHRGGVIAPGMQMMKRALQHETHELEYCGQRYALGLASATEHAIDSGVLYACIGLLERILREQDEGTHLLLTGGDAALIAPYLSYTAHLETNLVLQGLSVILEEAL
jgi:type III pantothenate kinase